MNEPRILLQELIDSLPPELPASLLPDIQQKVRQSGRKIVVLDDDPTGTQTVYDVAVLTEWPVNALARELKREAPVFYLLTNSRSLPLKKAQALNAEIGERLRAASAQTGVDYVVVSRSDSTLRGHFPGEVEALAEGLQQSFDAWLLVPFFLEGGRFTARDIHYVAEGGWLTPAGQTEFARDKTFGYRASQLAEWVEEKTGGGVAAGQVASISIEDLRLGGPAAVTRRLLSLPHGTICAVNAVSYRDLEVLVMGVLDAETQGRRYLYRTAASFVRVRAGLEPRPLLTQAGLQLPQGGAGLVIAGSYVPKTSAQLEALFHQAHFQPVQVHVPRLMEVSTREVEIERAVREVNQLLAQGSGAAVYTSRELVSVTDAEANLAIGQVVSNSLVEVVRGLQVRPRFLLAKGGITSSDIATQGLGIRRALVLGQILPGVPVWQTGPESRYPGMPYIVFPGNVGSATALAEIVNQLGTGKNAP